MANVKAVIIFEMLGRPAQHLKETMEGFIEKLSHESGVEITKKTIHEPKIVEKAESEIFTTFAEVEINLKDVKELLRIVFVYMPSHIEIISPEEIVLKNFDLNTLINELVRKLHQYDEIAKRIILERNILQRQLEQYKVNPVITQIKNPPQSKEKKVKKQKSGAKKVKKKAD